MPRYWHDRHSVNKMEDEDMKEFYRSIVADKKPYFMRYIYPPLMKQYKTYRKNTDKNSLREFDMTVDEMLMIPYKELTDRQAEFLRYYRYRMPVGTGDCVMNKICKKFEDAFDGHIKKHNHNTSFDYRFLRNDSEYSYSQYTAIKKLYDDYNQKIRAYTVFASNERVDDIEASQERAFMNEDFKRECTLLCPNKETLCNILLDICYSRSSTKRFVWNMCGSEIIHNLLLLNNNTISFPCLNPAGDIEYCGNKFSIISQKVEVN